MVWTSSDLAQEMHCSVSKVPWAAAPMLVLKLGNHWSVLLLAQFRVILSKCEEAWNPNAAGWLEKLWINLEDDILPAWGTGKSKALAWPGTIFMRFDAGCNLWSTIIRNSTNQAQKPYGDWDCTEWQPKFSTLSLINHLYIGSRILSD